MKADREFFRRDPEDPWYRRQARAHQTHMLAGFLTAIYALAVMYALETSSFVPAPMGGYMLGALFLIVFFILYWAGRVFCRQWFWVQIGVAGLIGAGTFLPFWL